MAKKYVIGVDLGGTKILTALADAKGKILAEVHLFTEADKGQKEVIGRVKKTVSMVLEKAGASLKQVKCIGVGAPGPVISSKGLIVAPPNLPGWKSVPLGKILKKAFKVPVILENDANAAALAEFYFGAARGTKDCIYLTVSTGIGGGIIIDGKLYVGSNGTAGEIGHTIIAPGADVCGCGHQGCFEIMASGRALTRYGLEFMGKELEPLEIQALAHKGEKGALQAINKLACYLAIGVANQINTLSPERVVIGGGLANLGKLLFDPLTAYVKEFALPSNLKGCKIKKAKLEKKVGVLGAIALCR